MRGASLTYNNVSIALTKTNSITSRPIMSSDGVDYLYTEYTIDIDGIISPTETAYLLNANGVPIVTPGTLPPITYDAIVQALNTERGYLIFTNFLTQMFNTPDFPAGYVSDANNGPLPRGLRLTRLDGGQLFHCNYQISTWINDCTNLPSYPAYYQGYLSNRYSQSQGIDENFYTHIHTTGEAYFDAGFLNKANVVADTFRSVLLPFIPPGFRRKSINFSVNSKANIISYECDDIETSYELGNTGDNGSQSFITKVDGIYRQSTIPTGGPDAKADVGNHMAIMNVKVWGSKKASNWNLTQFAYALIQSTKMNFFKPQVGFIRGNDISQSIVDRYVDVTVTMQLFPNVGVGAIGGPAVMGPFQVAGLGSLGGKSDNVLPLNTFNGINPFPPNEQGAAGYQDIQLLSAALIQACQGVSEDPCPQIGNYQGATPSQVYCGPPVVISVTASTTLPTRQNRYSNNYAYTEAEITSRYETQHGTYQAPVAGRPNSYSGGAGGSPTCSIMTLTTPVTYRIVEWSAERINQKPQFPALISSDPNQILIDSKIVAWDTPILYDNSIVYKVTGMYKYAFRQDISNMSPQQLPYDIPQWVSIPYGQSVVDLSTASSTDQAHGISDPTGPIEPI